MYSVSYILESGGVLVRHLSLDYTAYAWQQSLKEMSGWRLSGPPCTDCNPDNTFFKQD
jgi:hypothetical protein